MKYRELKGYKYQLIESTQIEVQGVPNLQISNTAYGLSGGVLYLSEGYCWDGASGPTFDTPAVMRAALVHDVLYQMIRQGLLPVKYRKTADENLRRIMLGTNPTRWAKIRAGYFYHSVRWFGASAAKPHIEQQNQVNEV